MSDEQERMSLRDAMLALHGARREDDVVVTSMCAAREWMALGTHPLDLVYVPSSMGQATSVGLGLALAQPHRRVIVVNGDGSMLMNLGSLATIASTKPPNLVLIVWDNEEYGTTGGQATATAHGADLDAGARAMGIHATVTVRTEEGLRAAIVRARVDAGPWVIVAKVQESAPAVKPPLDCVFIKQRFMAAIGTAEPATRGTHQ